MIKQYHPGAVKMENFMQDASLHVHFILTPPADKNAGAVQEGGGLPVNGKKGTWENHPPAGTSF
jgi:hypothetical protein